MCPAPTAGAAKSAGQGLYESLRVELLPVGVHVGLVSPGFVDTPMSRQFDSPKPFMITPEAGAAIMKKCIDCGVSEAAFPPAYAIARGAFAMLPRWLKLLIIHNLPSAQAVAAQ